MYRPLPPMLFLVCLAVALLLHWLAPGGRWIAQPWNWLGLVPLGLGIGMTVAGSQRFARERTNIHTFRAPDVLVTDGLFRFSRNPMYLGFVAALVGLCVVLGSASPWAAPIAFFGIANGWYIPFEERACRARFGADYDAYSARTRRWL